MTSRPLGFLGLGNMGGGMARWLLRPGWPVTVFDPVTQRVQACVAEGGVAAASPAAVAAASEIVLSSLPTPQAVEDAVAGPEGILRGLRPGEIYVDLSTIDPGTSRRMHARVTAAGGRMLDCPVGRGPEEAASGRVLLMVGGEAALLEEVRPVLTTLGDPIHHCGPAADQGRPAVLFSRAEAAMTTRSADLYEEDFYAWTRDQAATLRRLAAERWNLPLDLKHLAAEVEDLGKEQRNAVRSQLRRILEHRLKLACSPAREPRPGWRASILDALAEIEDRITPSLRRDLRTRLPILFARARDLAALGLEAHGWREAAARLPERCPWSLDELLTPPPEDDLDWRP